MEANPQRPMTASDYAEPIELNSFYIPGGLGRPIKDLIEPMLHPDPTSRPTAAEQLVWWQGIFLEAAKHAHALEGRVV